jgi:hypothetical protein
MGLGRGGAWSGSGGSDGARDGGIGRLRRHSVLGRGHGPRGAATSKSARRRCGQRARGRGCGGTVAWRGGGAQEDAVGAKAVTDEDEQDLTRTVKKG